MISVVKIYKDSLILEEKNFIVDDIEQYLSTLSDTITITNFQYVKHALELQIKINKSQMYLDMKAANDYNYISITNQDSEGGNVNKTIYYFVDSMEWGAVDTIRLNLIMDTINTFRNGVDFNLSAKTTTLREHKDRYKLVDPETTVTRIITVNTYCNTEDGGSFVGEAMIKTGASSITVNSITSNANSLTYSVTGGVIFVTVRNDNPFERITIVANVSYLQPATYQRIIDPVSEGMQSVQFKKDIKDITDIVDQRWYLVYKNNTAINPDEFNPQNPISLYLYTDKPISYKKYNNVVIHDTDLSNNEYLEINPNLDENLELSCYNTLTSRTETISIYAYESGGYLMHQGAIIYKYSGNLYLRTIFAKLVNNNWVYYYSDERVPDNTGIAISKQGTINVYAGTFTGDPSDVTNLLDLPYSTTSNDTLVPTYTTGSVLSTINTLDRTDSKIIRIIMTPYCPINFKVESGYYVLDGWEVTGDEIKSENVTMGFENTIETSIDSPLKELYLKSLNIDTTAVRNDINESKLLHSDFFQTKIVYDSFVYDIALENIDASNQEFMQEVVNNFILKFHTTNTIQSRFMFEFPQVKLIRSTQMFDNILMVNRNNELPIFTSAYFNYIRNGYNFDVKDKERAIAQADENLMFEANAWTFKTAGAAVNAMTTGNAGSLISTAVSGAGNLLRTISANAYLAMQLDSSIQRNLALARSTAISVSSNDDVNLLLKYCPVAKVATFGVSDLFKKAMADLFYYCGYTCNQKKVPAFSSRYWFNFIQAELLFDSTVNIPSEVLNDVISKYNDGVTVLHHHTTWDFSQVKENWEVSLL